MESKMAAMAGELEQLRNSQTAEKSELIGLHDRLSRNVSELVSAQNQLAKFLNS